jgi:polyhydroxyalkanoate synthesis regulator phasin
MSDSPRNSPESPSGTHSFFAAWMLLHEKADDWLRDAVCRANETPEEARKDYQTFLLKVDGEKELLKSLFADALVGELKHMGFSHRDDKEELKSEVSELHQRILGLEEQLDRLAKSK